MVVLGVAILELKQRLGLSCPLCWEAAESLVVPGASQGAPTSRRSVGLPPFPNCHDSGSCPSKARLVHPPPKLPASLSGVSERKEGDQVEWT